MLRSESDRPRGNTCVPAVATRRRRPGRGGIDANGPAYVEGVAMVSLAQRMVGSVGESPVSQRVADAQELMYGPVIDWARRSPLHTDALGHSVHPMLTHVTLGCWLGASILDLAGSSGAGPRARLLVAGRP